MPPSLDRRLPTIAVLLLLAACGASRILSPVDPAEVTISLSVTEGFAGADYAFEVDGASRVVRGVHCNALCEFATGEILARVSGAQVAHLSGALDRAGVLAFDGRDFGEGCCDFRHVELTYHRGERSADLRGSEDRIPRPIAEAIRILHPLARGVVPIIVSPETDDTDWPQDAYALGNVTTAGSELVATVTYSGGCAPHPMDLVAWGGWLESFPVQINALITHDDGDDPCDGIVTEERAFDLYTLARAYAEAYGDAGPQPSRVLLRLWDPTPGGPAFRSIEVDL